MNKTAINLSTLFGLGNLTKAPGTLGTIPAVFIYLLLPENLFSVLTNHIYFLIILIIISYLSISIITRAEKDIGHDHKSIVLDEFLGYFFAILFLPKNIFILVASFILFRIFDIFKPEPIDLLQKLPHGWGVMCDDIMSGVYANIVLQVFVGFIL